MNLDFDTDAVARPRFGHAQVWVESPLQLLSAVEAHGAGLLGRTSTIYPRGGTTMLDDTLSALMAQAPNGLGFARAARNPPTPSNSAADRWVIGDAYSGRVQRALLGPISPEELIIIDDGLATLGLLSALTSEEPVPLVRARSSAGATRRALGLASWWRLRALARASRLLVFTALPISGEVAQKFKALGGKLESHRFEWLGTQPVGEPIYEPTITVGSALAVDGLIRAKPYLQWLRELTEEGPVAYFPHRRESPDFLHELDDHPLISVRKHTIPIEMRLRSLRSGQIVRALPSTALPSLRLLLGSSGVRIIGKPVPENWWKPGTSHTLRNHLSSSLELKG